MQPFLYGSFHRLYPDFPLTTHFKQKRAQRARFNYQLPIAAVPPSVKTRAEENEASTHPVFLALKLMLERLLNVFGETSKCVRRDF
jgi:hypothetical protein